MSRHNALFSKYGVSVRTHVHEGICIPLVVKLSYLNILLQAEVIVLNYILHDCMLAAALVHFAFSPRSYVQGLLLCVCLLCE